VSGGGTGAKNRFRESCIPTMVPDTLTHTGPKKGRKRGQGTLLAIRYALGAGSHWQFAGSLFQIHSKSTWQSHPCRDWNTTRRSIRSERPTVTKPLTVSPGLHSRQIAVGSCTSMSLALAVKPPVAPGDTPRWALRPQIRTRGSIHLDWWRPRYKGRLDHANILTATIPGKAAPSCASGNPQGKCPCFKHASIKAALNFRTPSRRIGKDNS
jgi:hypothetical protein